MQWLQEAHGKQGARCCDSCWFYSDECVSTASHSRCQIPLCWRPLTAGFISRTEQPGILHGDFRNGARRLKQMRWGPSDTVYGSGPPAHGCRGNDLARLPMCEEPSAGGGRHSDRTFRWFCRSSSVDVDSRYERLLLDRTTTLSQNALTHVQQLTSPLTYKGTMRSDAVWEYASMRPETLYLALTKLRNAPPGETATPQPHDRD